MFHVLPFRPHSPRIRLRSALSGAHICHVRLSRAQGRAGWVRLLPDSISSLTAALAGQDQDAASQPALSSPLPDSDLPAHGSIAPDHVKDGSVPPDLFKDGRVSARRLAVWSYVLQALKIPHHISRDHEVLVPQLYARMATRHLAEYEYELAHPRRHRLPSTRPLASLTLLVILPLLLVYLFCTMDLPRPDGWPQNLRAAIDVFGMDNVRIALFGEWSRTVTALLVHADPGHLAANAAFSLIFCRILAGHTGPGLALFLTIWAGALGNVLTLPLREGYVLSVGFSTALFACIGATSGFVAHFSRPGALLPLACGAALLALLGTEGEHTDYTAHVCGLAAGMGSGYLAALCTRTWPALLGAGWQLVLGIAALALPLAAFCLRLS